MNKIDLNTIKVAVIDENDFTRLDATHFSNINQSLELQCLIDKENDKLIHYKVSI